MSPATEKAPNPGAGDLSRRNVRPAAPGCAPLAGGLGSGNNAGLTVVNSFCLCLGACLQVILLFRGKYRIRVFPLFFSSFLCN